jgi:hypothetical protein
MTSTTWRRTVIGSKTHPEDFIAEDENGRTIRRICRHHSGGWFWAFQAHGPDIDWPGPTPHVEDTKQQAADAVRQMFEQCRRPSPTER